jgi:hypothetical protein
MDGQSRLGIRTKQERQQVIEVLWVYGKKLCIVANL